MTILYKGHYYELVGLHEPKTKENYDIIAIFQVRFLDEQNRPITKEKYEEETNKYFNDEDCDFVNMEYGNFINYFYGESVETKDTIEMIAHDYIDDYLEKRKKDFLEKINELQRERVEEYGKDFANLPIDEQIERDDGDNLIQACETLKGVLEDEKR